MNQTPKPQPKLWQSFAPNPVLAVLMAVGFLAECLILLSAAPSFRATDWVTQAFGIAYVGWFWLTVGWCVFHVSKRWSRTDNQNKNRILRWTTVVLFSAATLVYCISWGLFFKTGRLANFEAVRFLAFNFRYLWDYLSQAEPIHLVVASLVVSTTLIMIPTLLRQSNRSRWSESERPRKPFMVWLLLTVVTFAFWKAIPVENSSLRRANRRRALSQELHPSFTVLVSYLETRTSAKIQPTLNTAELTRIDRRQAIASKAKTTAPPNDYSVIYVAIESLRHDTIHQVHQGKEVLPNINRLAKNGLQFTNAYAQSTHSDYADVCLVSSLYPLRTRHHHYYDSSDPWPKALIYDLLKPRGYSTAIISSQNEKWGGMSNFLQSPNLDLFYHPETAGDDAVFQEPSDLDVGFAMARKTGTLKAGKFPDHHTTSRAISWIRNQQQPFFLSMNFQSSHFPYLIPDGVARPFQPCDLSSNISFASYPESETEKVRNAFFNAIHECDRQVGRLVQALKEQGKLDRTILVITGENGEAFHECGSVTHAREPVEPAIHIACIMHAPGLLPAGRESYPFEHIDLVPTTLGLLGVPSHPNFQGMDVLAKQRIPAEQRLTFCHVNTCFAHCDAVMLGGRWKLVKDLSSREVSLFDTVEDPNETTNLFDSKAKLVKKMLDCLEQWRQNQLSYYHFPQYYVDFYPPRAPVWKQEQRTKLTSVSD